jgi:hypothetical protein
LTKPEEDLHYDAPRMTMLVNKTKIKGLIREARRDGRFHIHRDVPTPESRGLESPNGQPWPVATKRDEWIAVCRGPVTEEENDEEPAN